MQELRYGVLAVLLMMGLQVDCFRLPTFNFSYGWISGTRDAAIADHWGQVRVPAETNLLSRRFGHCSVMHPDPTQAIIYVFGGIGQDDQLDTSRRMLADLWQFDIKSGGWTWIAGLKRGDRPGVYTALDTYQTFSNFPGGRAGTMTTSDAQDGMLYLYGGFGYDGNGGTRGILGDLWGFNVASGLWKFVTGASLINQIVAHAPQETPGGRDGATLAFYRESSTVAYLYLFGGSTIINSAPVTSAVSNDLYRFRLSDRSWQYLGGSFRDPFPISTITQPRVPGGWPGGRGAHGMAMFDGNLYIFGGQGLGFEVSADSYINDFWVYNTTSSQWTWLTGGSKSPGIRQGSWGSFRKEGPGGPSGRSYMGLTSFALPSTSSADKNATLLLLWGGMGFTSDTCCGSTVKLLDDMWVWSAGSGNWTWVAGSTTGIAYRNTQPGEEQFRYGVKGQMSTSYYPPNKQDFGGFAVFHNNSGASSTSCPQTVYIVGGQGWPYGQTGDDIVDGTSPPANDVWAFTNGLPCSCSAVALGCDLFGRCLCPTSFRGDRCDECTDPARTFPSCVLSSSSAAPVPSSSSSPPRPSSSSSSDLPGSSSLGGGGGGSSIDGGSGGGGGSSTVDGTPTGGSSGGDDSSSTGGPPAAAGGARFPVAAVAGAAGGGLCCLMLLAVLCMKRRRGDGSTAMKRLARDTGTISVASVDLSSRSASQTGTGSHLSQPEPSHLGRIPLKELKLGEVCGEGFVGVVHKATWRGTEVAAKLMKRPSPEAVADFVNEESIAGALARHPRVVAFFGAWLEPEAGVCLLVMSYMPFGSLRDCLVLRGEYVFPGGDEAQSLEHLRIISEMVVDASAGILHCHSQGVVHRDIAARNFLVDQFRRVYVSDFGMSKILEDGHTEGKVVRDLPVPIKWSAPESLIGGVYSTASDVWMFGVFLFEVVAREQPYAGVAMKDVAEKVVAGELRPRIPDWCPTEWATLMKACWAPVTFARPTMGQINETLSSYLERTKAATSLGQVYHPLKLGVAPPSDEGKDAPAHKPELLYTRPPSLMIGGSVYNTPGDIMSGRSKSTTSSPNSGEDNQYDVYNRSNFPSVYSRT